MPRLAIDIEAQLASFDAGIKRVEQTTAGLAGRLDSAFSGVQTALGALVPLLAGGSLAALVRNFADAGDQLAKLSTKTTIAVEALGELQYAASLSDVTSEELGKGLTKLRLEIEQAAGGAKDSVQAFEALGIKQKELATLGVDQIFKRIADRVAEGKAGAAELAKVLGDRNWATFAPLMAGGAAELTRLGAEARKAGVVMSSETAKASEAFNDNLTRLTASLRGVGYELAGPIVNGLAQVAQAMVDATQKGGALMGILRGVAELGKIALQGGADDPVAKQRAYVQELRGEIQTLQESLSGNGSLGTGLLDRLIYGDERTKRNRLAELRISLSDAERALGNIQKQAAATPPAVPAVARRITQATTQRADPFAAGTERQARRGVDVILDQLRTLGAARQEIQRELEGKINEGVGKSFEQQVAEQTQRLQGLLADTPAGRTQAIQGDLDTLNDSLIAGRISAEQYNEAFLGIQERFDQLNGVPKDFAASQLDPMTEAFDRLETAIKGWGSAFNEELVQALKRGQLDVKKIVDTILTDIARLAIYRSITQPLFGAIQNGATALFGGAGAQQNPNYYQFGGRASGGPVYGGASGGSWIVGERGPERLFMAPGTRGFVAPNAAGGAVLNQQIVINAPVNPAVIRAAVQQGAVMARSEIGRAARVGAMS